MTNVGEHLEVSRLIKADPQRVFDAWTNPAMIVEWWGAGGVTSPAAEVDLAVGGVYRIANETPDGHVMWISGTFTQVNPPTALTYTWHMEPVDPELPPSIVDVRFDPAPTGTVVTIKQTQIASPEARDVHLAGWTGCLEGLTNLLSAT